MIKHDETSSVSDVSDTLNVGLVMLHLAENSEHLVKMKSGKH